LSSPPDRIDPVNATPILEKAVASLQEKFPFSTLQNFEGWKKILRRVEKGSDREEGGIFDASRTRRAQLERPLGARRTKYEDELNQSDRSSCSP